MADLKKLQEMAKNGEVSKKLLEDEEFKSELKNILKEECGVEITDSEIPEMLKKLEENLYREQKEDNQVLSGEDLEGVSGGVSRAYMIKLAFTYAGCMIGWKAGVAAGGQFIEKCKKEMHEIDEKTNVEINNMLSSRSGNAAAYAINTNKIKDRKIRLAIMKDAGTVSAGMLAGASAGNYIGKLICEKFNIK